MNEVELKDLQRRAMLCYERHPRNRKYALDSPSKRHLCAVFQACLDAKGSGDVLPLYHAVLEKLTDEYGANLLRSKPREPQPIREPWKDAWGNVLPNPFKTGDMKGQRILRVHDRELADQYERSAKDGYGFEQARREDARECAEQNKVEAAYNEVAHEHNPFANSASEADRNAFAKTFSERVAIYQREAKPPRSNIFGREQNETVRTQIVKTDPDLWHVVELAERYSVELVKAERLKAEREAEAARRKIAELAPIAGAHQHTMHSLDSTPEERVHNPQPFL